MVEPTNPSLSVLCKIGSIIKHAEEALSDARHSFDYAAIDSLLTDPEVQEWLKAMDKLALLPVLRQSR